MPRWGRRETLDQALAGIEEFIGEFEIVDVRQKVASDLQHEMSPAAIAQRVGQQHLGSHK